MDAGPSRVALLALALAVWACQPTPPAGPSEGPSEDRSDGRVTRSPALRAAVTALLRAPEEEALEAALATWWLPRASFARVVAPSHHRLYEGYLAEKPRHARRLALALASARTPTAAVTEARHWAQDPALSLAQARTRWAQPLQAVSWRISVGGTAIDAVWVEDGGRFYLLEGIDDAALALVGQTSPTCAAVARRAGRPGPCSDAVWGAVDAALRDRPEALERSCARALGLCGSDAEPGSR